MEDWFFDNLVKVIISLLVVLVVIMMLSGKQMAEDKAAFMAECIQHRENYECVAMWRAGKSHASVVPVFIPVR